MNKQKNESPAYWSVITADVRYDKSLSSSQKILFAEITSLQQSSGICWASNNYFAKLYDVDPSTVSKWVKGLEEKGYICIKYVYEGKNIKERHIELKQYPIDISQQPIEKNQQPIEKTPKLIIKANNKKDNNKNIIPSTKANKLGKSRGILSSEEFDNIMNL